MENQPVQIKPLTFADISQTDPNVAYLNDQKKKLLYNQPPKQWIKPHPIATKKIVNEQGSKQEVPAEYIPIDKVEYLLDRIFQDWKIEVLAVTPLFNAIGVTVRVHYKDLDGDWKFHDGVGAAPLQLNKDAKAFDLSQIKSGAVQIGLPAAKSYAIKDACEHLGNLFGRNINRADADYEFSGAYNTPPKPTQPDSDEKFNERIMIMLNDCKTRDALKKLESQLVTNEHRTKYDELWKKLK